MTSARRAPVDRRRGRPVINRFLLEPSFHGRNCIGNNRCVPLVGNVSLMIRWERGVFGICGVPVSVQRCTGRVDPWWRGVVRTTWGRRVLLVGLAMAMGATTAVLSGRRWSVARGGVRRLSWRLSRRLTGVGIGGQGTSLGYLVLSGQRVTVGVKGLGLGGGFLGLGTGVVVGNLNPDLTGVLALAGEVLPEIVLTAAGDDDVAQVDPCLSDQFCLLVVIEDGDFELVVVG